MITSKARNFFIDCRTMYSRCLKLSFRNIGMIATSIIIPVILLVLFIYVFGGVMEGSFGMDQINYLVAGAVIMAIAQSASSTAAVVCSDIHKGLLDRFSSMPVSKASFLIGHAISALFRNLVSAIVLFAISFAMGFRPQASFTEWLCIIGVLIAFMLVMTLFCIFLGLLVKTPEIAGSSIHGLTEMLVFLSSSFVPTKAMVPVLKAIADNQPITHIANTVRALTMGIPVGNSLWISMVWCAGLIILFFSLSIFLFRRKLTM